MKKISIGIGVIILVVLVFLLTRGTSEAPTISDTISPEASPSISPVVSSTPDTSKQPDISNKYPPATCQLSGSIVFRNLGLSENRNAAIAYQNIDSAARQIKWTISPKDDLSVGPNLFATLRIPNGREDVTVGLPSSPAAKNYALTAVVTYGRFVKGNLEIHESRCSGQIPVTLSF